MFADFTHAKIGGKPATEVIGDEAWLKNDFLPTVGKRGAAIIEARGLSSAASAANALIDHVRDLATPGTIHSVAVHSRRPLRLRRGRLGRHAGEDHAPSGYEVITELRHGRLRQVEDRRHQRRAGGGARHRQGDAGLAPLAGPLRRPRRGASAPTGPVRGFVRDRSTGGRGESRLRARGVRQERVVVVAPDRRTADGARRRQRCARPAELRRDGQPTNAQGPGLAEDVSAVREMLTASDQPTVVVAHSYGGIVTAEAAAGVAAVRHLLLVSSYLPEVGQPLLVRRRGARPFLDTIPRAAPSPSAPDALAETFLQDSDPEFSDRPRPRRLGGAWRSSSSRWGQRRGSTGLDVPRLRRGPGRAADRQRRFAGRAGSVVELDAGHHPFLSRRPPSATSC